MYNKDPIGEIHSYGIDIKNRAIYLNCAGEDDSGVDHRMASTFIKNITYLNLINTSPIFIHMHSTGGDWGPGMAIFDAIRASESFVTTYCYGQAESMSSIILQAADHRVMMPKSYLMVHFGSSDVSGNHLDNMNWSEFNKILLNDMMDIYACRCSDSGEFFSSYNLSKTKAYIKRKMKNGDWYMTAEEAVYYGFADEVYKGT